MHDDGESRSFVLMAKTKLPELSHMNYTMLGDKGEVTKTNIHHAIRGWGIRHGIGTVKTLNMKNMALVRGGPYRTQVRFSDGV